MTSRNFSYALLEGFLDDAEARDALEYAIGAEGQFTEAKTSTGAADFREARVIYTPWRFADLVRDKIRPMLGELLHHFEIEPFPVGDIECQLTAHGDGDFFKLHNDSGSPDTASRVLTYVYYFHRSPRRFTGGELRVYHSLEQGGVMACGEAAAEITPASNSVLFFESFRYHEVLPVSCPGGEFGDGRFTINGWIRRAG
jgi:SM-20-related protein